MARYISERHAQEAMSTLICDCIRDKKTPTYDDVANMLLTCPTADVQEVKHGKWVEYEKGMIVTSYKCSLCGRIVRDDTGYDVVKDYPYCHCGAKMDYEVKCEKLGEE